MTRAEFEALAEALRTFEAFSDLRFGEMKLVIRNNDGTKVDATLAPDETNKLWRSMTDAAVKHIKTQMAQHEAIGATMN